MKKVLFTGASFLLLSAGIALAGQPKWGGDDGGNPPSSSTSKSDNTAILAVLGSNYAVGGSSLSTTSTHTHIDMKLATAVSNGDVTNNKVINKPCLSQSYGGATMSSVNGGTGILSAQQNTGANALQQTTVALGSSIQGSNNLLP